jgi:proline iminopeptidase
MDGEPLLMLHGRPGVPDSMKKTVAPLLPEMRSISFDQRGVGSSACMDGRYDIASYQVDIEAIREDQAVSSWHVLATRGAGCSPRPTPPVTGIACRAWP